MTKPIGVASSVAPDGGDEGVQTSPDYVFGDELRTMMAERVCAHDVEGITHGGRRHAAVAVTVIGTAEGRAGFVITRRAPRLRAHAGQWALPGGRVEPGETAEVAALRELHEEVGLRVAPEAVLGRLDDYATRSGYVISPVVVWGGSNVVWQVDAGEVAHVYEVPLVELDRPESPRFVTIPESDRPLVQFPLLGSSVNAPTAAVLYQFREVAMHGRLIRVSHFEQPVFAWK